MTAPTVHYARAPDGILIAYAVSGSGPVLISVPAPPDNHIGLEWEDPERRRHVERLSRHRTLVRFDGRGTGLSDRDVDDFSLHARIGDLQAVADRVAPEPFVLLSGGHGCQVAVAYAARQPHRVSHLVAFNPFVHGHDFMTSDELSLWRHLLTADFRMFTDAQGAEMFGWGKEEGPRYAAFFRACVEPATALRIYEAMLEVDLTPYLPDVACPVLVIRTSEFTIGTEAAVRRFTAGLRDPHIAVLDGRPVESGTPEMVAQIGRFLGEDWSDREEPPAANGRPASGPAGLRTVLFTDIEGHTGLMQRLGDSRGRELLRTYEQLTREALRRFAGSEVKALGDGFMASFRSALAALDCAVDLQRAFASRLPGFQDDLRIRIGLNAGEPIEEDGDLFGSTVIAASRIVSLAVGGEILVSNVVRELASGKGYLFGDRGLHELRGFEEAMRVWELSWKE